MDLLLAFLAGIVVATIVWYFVLRNNKNKIQLWLSTPEAYFQQVQSEVGTFSADMRKKVEDIVAEIKRKQR